MKKQPLTLVAIATATLFSIGLSAQASAQAKPLQSNRSFNTSMFSAKTMSKDQEHMMVSKEEYMKEMEHRWMMAEKMQGTTGKPGWVKFGNLNKSMKEQPNVSNGGGAK